MLNFPNTRPVAMYLIAFFLCSLVHAFALSRAANASIPKPAALALQADNAKAEKIALRLIQQSAKHNHPVAASAHQHAPTTPSLAKATANTEHKRVNLAASNKLPEKSQAPDSSLYHPQSSKKTAAVLDADKPASDQNHTQSRTHAAVKVEHADKPPARISPTPDEAVLAQQSAVSKTHNITAISSTDTALPLIKRPQFSAVPTPPRYPAVARKRGQEGIVWLEIELDRFGKQTRREVTISSGYSHLDRAALTAVTNCEFLPHRENNLAMAAKVLIPVHFKLHGRES